MYQVTGTILKSCPRTPEITLIFITDELSTFAKNTWKKLIALGDKMCLALQKSQRIYLRQIFDFVIDNAHTTPNYFIDNHTTLEFSGDSSCLGPTK